CKLPPSRMEIANVNPKIREQFRLDDADRQLAGVCREVAERAGEADLDATPAFALEIMMGWASGSPTMLDNETLKEARSRADDLLFLARKVAAHESPKSKPPASLEPLEPIHELARHRLRKASGKPVHVVDIRTAMGLKPTNSQRDAKRQYRACILLMKHGLAEKVKARWWRSLECEP